MSFKKLYLAYSFLKNKTNQSWLFQYQVTVDFLFSFLQTSKSHKNVYEEKIQFCFWTGLHESQSRPNV